MFGNLTFSFIGGTGNLGSAMIRGLIRAGVSPNQIVVSNRSLEKLKPFMKELGVLSAQTNSDAVLRADVVFIAVKPQFLEGICKEIGLITQRRRPLVISLVGVINLADILKSLGGNTLGLVRVMTNTPAEYCKGTTAMFANAYLEPPQKILAESIFNVVGSAFWVDNEETLNTLTAPVGCAPAYVFLFLEALQKEAVMQGVPDALSAKFALTLVLGAIGLAKQSGDSFSKLREKATTPVQVEWEAAYVFQFLESLQDATMSRGISEGLAALVVLNTVLGAVELANQSSDSFSILREKVTTPGGVTEYSLTKMRDKT